jgi:hypothetical protein
MPDETPDESIFIVILIINQHPGEGAVLSPYKKIQIIFSPAQVGFNVFYFQVFDGRYLKGFFPL